MHCFSFMIYLMTLCLLCSGKAQQSSKKKTNPLFLNETYSTGFLSNSNGGDLFYILFYSRSEPDTDPLILWLTGGPGCSSELALFTENGPLKINQDNETLSINPYAWNNNANLLYVDQPAGTGYSSVNHYDSLEGEVALDFFNFFKRFLKKYPEFKGRDFYVTGESFAGHYIPVIASFLDAQEDPDINVRGIVIGNGWVDPLHQYPGYVSFAYENGLIGQDEYETLSQQAITCQRYIVAGDFANIFNFCPSLNSDIMSSPPRFNIYDIRLPCNGHLCYDFSFVDHFLAKPEVQEALGVVGRPWTECNHQVHKYFNLDHEMGYAHYVANLLEKGIPALVYSGDQDWTCNYKGGEAWTNALKFSGHEDFKKAEYKSFEPNGLYKTAHGLTFFRVIDAGHLVPMDQPETAISMLQSFIEGKL